MEESTHEHNEETWSEDGTVDAVAASLVIITLVVLAVLWVAGH